MGKKVGKNLHTFLHIYVQLWRVRLCLPFSFRRNMYLISPQFKKKVLFPLCQGLNVPGGLTFFYIPHMIITFWDMKPSYF
jgi:hypothetical protein